MSKALRMHLKCSQQTITYLVSIGKQFEDKRPKISHILINHGGTQWVSQRGERKLSSLFLCPKVIIHYYKTFVTWEDKMEIQRWQYKIFQGHFEKEYGQTLLYFMDGSGHTNIDKWGYDGWGRCGSSLWSRRTWVHFQKTCITTVRYCVHLRTH